MSINVDVNHTFTVNTNYRLVLLGNETFQIQTNYYKNKSIKKKDGMKALDKFIRQRKIFRSTEIYRSTMC